MLKLAQNKIATCFAREIEAWAAPRWQGFQLSYLRLDWSNNRTRSKGGMYYKGPGISIAMAKYSRRSVDAYRVYEYSSFDKDPEIGGFFTDNIVDAMRMVICHEMAHACQYYDYEIKGYKDVPHGQVFKDIYRDIRNVFLNPYLPNQELVKELFCKQAVDDRKLALSEI